MLQLNKGERIFFNGDSITDCGRDRNDLFSLAGYVKMIDDRLQEAAPEKEIKCYNRGISGNRSGDVLARIRGELSEIRPTVFALMIGINDVWRKYDSGEETSHESYEKNVDAILNEVKAYTDRIVVFEPFVILSDPKKFEFYDDLMPKIVKLRNLCHKHRAVYIPLDGMFAEAATLVGPAIYSGDGIHPSEEGNRLIADAFLKRVAF